jgi:TIR domain
VHRGKGTDVASEPGGRGPLFNGRRASRLRRRAASRQPENTWSSRLISTSSFRSSVKSCWSHLDTDPARDDLWLQVASDDQGKVYGNGRQIFRWHLRRSLLPLDTVGQVRLVHGTNVLVFKVVNDGQRVRGGHLVIRMFICDRRDDCADQADRVFDRLVAVFHRNRVFKDVDPGCAGADSPERIEEALKRVKIVLLIIGPSWLSATDDRGCRRLDDKDDVVRLELECALRLDKVVIPVLVGGGALPRFRDLPETLRAVAFRHPVSVRAGPDFHRDMDRLIRAIKFRGAGRRRPISEILARAREFLPHTLAAIALLFVASVVSQLFNEPLRDVRDPAARIPEAGPPGNAAPPAYPAGRAALPRAAAPAKVSPEDSSSGKSRSDGATSARQ